LAAAVCAALMIVLFVVYQVILAGGAKVGA